MSDKLTRKKLKNSTDELIETLTSEEMVGRMKQFKALPPENRIFEASKLLSVDGLREMGVSMPEGMRLSSRYFEKDIGTFEFGDGLGDVDALDKLREKNPEFLEKLKTKFPDVYKKLRIVPDEVVAIGVSDTVKASACGGAGGTVAGTGGCACGGASTD